MDNHVDPKTYPNAGHFQSDEIQPYLERPITCREREHLLNEIDYWQRAYKIAQERRDRDKRDNYHRHMLIIDIAALLTLSTVSVSIFIFIFRATTHWLEFGF